MAVKLLCDWNNHKKHEIVCPDQSHEFELIKLGYAELIQDKFEFVLKEVSEANKESEQLWTILREIKLYVE